MTQALLPSIRQSENASIINIGSVAATGGYSGITAYTAAKTGLLGFTRSLSAELQKDEIRVVMLNPGPADTPMRWAATPEFDRKMVLAVETIADTIWWLASLPKGTTTSEFLLRSLHLELASFG
jgi:NAD(P)-dependent dehydrogenase (short-subunit alcohol dehydrogenase family)